MNRSTPSPAILLLGFAMLAALLSATACSLPRAATTHLAWKLDRNLVVLDGAAGGVAGRFIVGTAHPATILDFDFDARPDVRGLMRVTLGGRFAATARPVRADLAGLADGILGADVWAERSLTIDYRRGVIILGRDLERFGEGLRHSFDLVPSVPVLIDGVERLAVIDTANPDTIVLPETQFGPAGRRRIHLQVGEVRFDGLDARVANVSEIRLGNRVLARFLLTVDYPRRETTLWPH